jgi:hypothetical protein
MHEVRACLPAVRRTDPVPLAVFTWRAALLVVPPIALVAGILALAAIGGAAQGVAAAACAVAVAGVSLKGKPECSHAPGWLRMYIGLPIVASAVLLVAICARPFSSVSPRYPRIHLADRAGEV